MHQEFTPKDIARFWSKVDRSGGPDACWPWTGSLTHNGYGRFSVSHTTIRAHRFAWELTNGPIPDGFQTHHDCPGGDNPACCNPTHLWLGTQVENVADRDTKGRTARGDTSGPRMHPERMARGDRHGFRLHPERVPRGDTHYAHLRPETRPRGEDNGKAVFTETQVRSIRDEYATGDTSLRELATKHGVSRSAIAHVVKRRVWRHVV